VAPTPTPTRTPDPNQPPQVNAGADVITAFDAQPVTLSATVSDDGRPNPTPTLTLAWTQVDGPGTVTFGAPAAATTSAAASAVGSYRLRLTASDGVLSGSDEVMLHVDLAAANVAPTLDPIADQTIAAGTALRLGLVGHDGNPFDALSYSLVDGPPGASVDAQGIFGFAPLADQLGMHAVTVQVADGGGLSAERTFAVEVITGNRPPVLGALADATIPSGVPFVRALSATDPDAGDVLTYALLSGTEGMTLAGAQLAWTPAAGQFGTFVVRVAVRDRSGAESRGEFTLVVPAPAAPTAQDDRYEVILGRTLTVPAAGVLANDASVDGTAITAQLLTQPAEGTVSAFGADGSFTYVAPPAVPPPPPLDATIKYQLITDNIRIGSSAPLVADLDDDGKPEIIFFDVDRLWVAHGDTGEILFQAGALPEPYSGCALFGKGNADHFAVGDVDDDGIVEIVLSAQCAADNYNYIYVAGNATRAIALAYDAEAAGKFRVKWLSDPVGQHIPVAGGDGHLHVPFGGQAAYTSFTIARLRPSERPTVLFGKTYSGYGGELSYCGKVLAGKTDPSCRFVFAIDGGTGAVKPAYYSTPDDPAHLDGYDYTVFNGSSPAPVVADVDDDGALEILYQGTLWEIDGTVKRQFDGTLATGTGTNDSAIVDLDGDAQMEILTLDNANYRRSAYLKAWKPDGRLLWSLTIPGSTVVTNLSIGDIDRSGRPSILLGVYDTLWAVDAAGRVKWLRTFPLLLGFLPFINGAGMKFPVYDLNGDGVVEIIVQPDKQRIHFLRGDTGETQTSWEYPNQSASGTQSVQAPVIADLDGSGEANLIWYHDVNVDETTLLQVLKGDTAPWRAAPQHYNQRAYWGSNFEPDGSVPTTYPRHTTEAATNVFAEQPPQPYSVEPRERTQTSFTYAAKDGPLASAPATVTIDILPENRPPVITALPAATYPEGFYLFDPLTFQIAATDPDVGDTVSFALTYRGCGEPNRVTISPTGLFSYAEGTPNETLCWYQVRATDNHGAFTDQPFSIFFTSETRIVPEIIGLDHGAALAALAAVDLGIGTVAEVPNVAPAGQVLTQSPLGEAEVPRRTLVQLSVSLGPGPLDTDDDGDGVSENQGDCNDADPAFSPELPEVPGNGIDENCDGSERIVREIVVEPGRALRVTGEQVAFGATAIYLDGTSTAVTPNWASSAPAIASITAAGSARALAIGSTAIRATFGGAVGQAALTVADRAAGDQDDPTALITAPAAGDSVTGLTQILGTAADPTFLRYALELAPAGETTFSLIGEGRAAVTDGVLGTLDPTILMNGIYVVRLTVWDSNGNQASAEQSVQVEGAQKVGNFTLTFSDVTLPVSGIPIEVVRTYDSRDKHLGDFGVGWRLGLNTLQISTNRVLGTGWRVIKPGLSFGLQATDEHFVSVTLPTGRVERFRLVIEPMVSALVPLSFVRARLAPRPGAIGTLESLDNTNLLIADAQPGEVSLLDDTTLNAYDPDRFRYTTPDGAQFVVSRRNGLESIRDPNGNVITVGPDGITHSAGASVGFTRDGLGRISAVTDAMGATQTYAYDAGGDLVTHTDRTGDVTRFRYARNHDLLEIIGPTGRRATRNEYDDTGRLIASIDPDGNRFEYAHDLANRLDIQRDPDGAQRVYGYDERGNVVSQTDELGHTTTRTYDANDRMLSETDPLGRTISFTYDAEGRELSRTNDAGEIFAYAYGTTGQLASITDPLGQTTTFTRDARGNTTQHRDAAGEVTTFVYDAAGNLTQRTDAAGQTTRYEVDGLGRRTGVIDESGHRTDIAVNANGNVIGVSTQVTTPSGPRTLTVTGEYDAEGRPTRLTDADGRVVTGEYDVSGNLTALVDAAGQRVEMAYNDRGQVLSTTLPDGTVVASTYDLKGRLTQATDGNGLLVRHSYDAAGNLIRVALPDATLSTAHDNPAQVLEYDAAQQFSALIDPTGNRVEVEYDDTGQVVGGRDALGPAASATRDALGRVVSRRDALGRETQFAYDGMGRVLRTTYPDGAIVTTAYDAVGNLTSVTDPGGRTTRFEYDALGRRRAVIDALGGRTEYTYDEVGRLVRQRDAAGRDTRFEYDSRGLRTATVLPLGQRETRTFDASGRLSAVTDFTGARLRRGRSRHHRHGPLNKGGGRLSGLDGLLFLAYPFVGLPTISNIDLSIGSSTLYSSAVFTGVESSTLAGGYAQLSANASGGLPLAILQLIDKGKLPTAEDLAGLHNGVGISLSVQGFAGGVSLPFLTSANTYFSLVPGASAGYVNGISLDRTPSFWNNQVDPRPPPG